MTKYEWESELKRNIHRLPKAEQDKAVDYYNELFSDKAERGMSETQIIAEFGNPCDVADKILAEYQFDLRPPEEDTVPTPVKERPAGVAAKGADTPPEADKPKKAPSARPQGVLETILKTAVGIILGIVSFGVSFAIWLVAAVAVIIGWVLLAGGAAGTVCSVVAYTSNMPAMFAAIGVSLACAGVGLIIALNTKWIIKRAAEICKAFFGTFRNWTGKSTACGEAK